MTTLVRDELVPHFAPQAADVARQKVRYSDTNYQLLGALVEATEDAPLHEVFERELLEPLGLERTYLFPHRRSAETREPAAVWVGDGMRDLPLALGSFNPDGGMVAPMDDAIRFLRALVEGRAFQDSTTLEAMQARWNRFGLPLDASGIAAAQLADRVRPRNHALPGTGGPERFPEHAGTDRPYGLNRIVAVLLPRV